MFSKHFLGRAFLLAVLCLGLVTANAPIAKADSITEEMQRLAAEAEQASYDVISIMSQISQIEGLINQVNGEIEQSAADLVDAREALSKFVTEDYKTGKLSMLDIILSSEDFDQFISQVVYANKIAESERRAIEQVDALYTNLVLQRNELEQFKAERENCLVEQTRRLEAASAASSAASTYYEQLDDTQRAAYQQEVETQRQEAVAESMQILETIIQENASSSEPSAEAAPANDTQAAEAPTLSEEQASVIMEAIQSDPEIASAYAAETESSASTTVDVSSVDGDFLTRVYSLLGSGYQWSGYNYTGENDTSSFTCSGVVDYALGRDSQSSSPETLYDEVGGNVTTDVSELNAGDLVFYSYGDREVGHVGVYVGDGYIIDSIPNGGVAVREYDYMDFVGGGSL